METGTYLGDTALCVSRMAPGLPVFTCEINRRFHGLARRRLAGRANVRSINAGSREFLPRLLELRLAGDRPLFYLDAHWYDDWPLADEVRIVTELSAGIIIIDDFMVPGRPQFRFDVGGGGGRRFSGRETSDDRVCGPGLIRPVLSRGRRYQAWLPKYGRAEAFPVHPWVSRLFPLRGYVVIFLAGKDGSWPAVPFFDPRYYYQSEPLQ